MAVLNIYLSVTTYGHYKGIDDSIETKDFSESQTPGASTTLKGIFPLIARKALVHNNISIVKISLQRLGWRQF